MILLQSTSIIKISKVFLLPIFQINKGNCKTSIYQERLNCSSCCSLVKDIKRGHLTKPHLTKER